MLSVFFLLLASPAPHAAWASARRRALQDSIAACEYGHEGYIVELDTTRAGVAGPDRMARLEKLVHDATKPSGWTTKPGQHGASAAAGVTRRLYAISALAVEVIAEHRHRHT